MTIAFSFGIKKPLPMSVDADPFIDDLVAAMTKPVENPDEPTDALRFTIPATESLRDPYASVWAARTPDPDPTPDDVSEPDEAAEAAALAEVVTLAQEPLDADTTPLNTLLAAMANHEGRPAPLGDPDAATLAALETIATSHRSTVDGTVALLASGTSRRDESRNDTLALAAIDVLRTFAARPAPPAPPAPDVHVHVPKHDLNVHVDGPTFTPQIDVHVPEQPMPAAPIVNVDVAAAEAPVVHVTVPDRPIEVHVPAQESPQVHVHVPDREPSRASSVRIEYDAEGTKRFVPEYDNPA